MYTTLCRDKIGNFWFGTHTKGVSKYDGTSFRNYTKNEGLAENRISSIIQDRAGNVWIATQGGGFSKYEGNSFTNYTTAQGLAGNLVFYITLPIIQKSRGWQVIMYGVLPRIRPEAFGSAHMKMEPVNAMARALQTIQRSKDCLVTQYLPSLRIGLEICGSEPKFYQ